MDLYRERAYSTNMDIDLLFTEKGGAGLIANENFVKKMLGAVLDTKTGLFIAEFNDGDFMETNIPVEGEYFDTLDHCAIIHIGAVKNGNIAQAYQVPLMFADLAISSKAVSSDNLFTAKIWVMKARWAVSWAMQRPLA